MLDTGYHPALLLRPLVEHACDLKVAAAILAIATAQTDYTHNDDSVTAHLHTSASHY